MKRKIFLRVTGLLVGLIVTVTVLTCVFALRYHRAGTIDVFGAQLTVLSGRAEDLILWEDRVALADLLRGTVADHDVVEYAFIERHGRPYVHTFDKGVPKGLLGLPGGTQRFPLVRELEDTHGRRFIDLAMAIGDERAALHLGLSSSAINRQALPQVLSVAALGGVAIIIGIVFAAVTTGMITREIAQATAALRTEISERKRAEQELGRYRDQLEELVRQRTRALEESQERIRQAERLASIGTFAAGVAHEINNPLASILMSARHALRSMQDRTIARTSLQEIIEDTERCAHIVKGILLFAKQQPSEKEPVNLNEAVQRATDLTRKYADRCGVRLEVNATEGLPFIDANLTELEQVFVNVIKNAIEASSEGQTVGVQTARDHDTLVVRVQDRGRGMAPEEKRQAFDPFYTTRAKEGGSGLGLSIAHGTVADHGGTISIDSEPGTGTAVSIEFQPQKHPTLTRAT
ncbi:MAG: sensor histidine kinase [Planctomycetota bacterium]